MKSWWEKRCIRKKEKGKDIQIAGGRRRKERNDEEKMAEDTSTQSIK